MTTPGSTTPQAPDPHDAANDQIGRDDAGRSDDSPGFDIQARMFTFIGVFLTVASLGYGLWTREAAGATMLALASGLAFVVGGYVGWTKPSAGVRAGHAEHGHGDEDPWFPDSSIWPFALSIGLVMVANGLLLGTWLLLPGAGFLLYAVSGFVLQTRRRA